MPSRSETILINRICEALFDSKKTAVGISNYIKARYYRSESTFEIKKVIKLYLSEKVTFDSFYELYRIKRKDTSEDEIESIINNEQPKKDETQFNKEKVLFLNELFIRRQDLLVRPYHEKIGILKNEIIQINAEIKGMMPLAIEEIKMMPSMVRNELFKELFSVLRIELEKQRIPFISNSRIFNDSLNQEKTDLIPVFKEFEDTINLSSIESSAQNLFPNESKSLQSNEKERSGLIEIEKVIRMIVEEKIRLGKIDGNLLAENILFRIKKDLWD